MPNIYINGTLIPNGASSISSSNPITLSWDGLDSDYYYLQHGTYICISAYDASDRFVSLSFSGNTGDSDPIYAYFDRYGDLSDHSSWSGYMQVGSSGSVSIAFSSDIQGGEINLDVIVASNIVQQSVISVTTPTVAPSNFTAVQDGKHIKFTWTAGSGEGTMTYWVHEGGNVPVPGCSSTTSTSSVCTDCSSYYGKTINFTLEYYLNGSIKGYLSYRLSVVTPSVLATITITQASKSKQVTVSWNGSCSGFTATSKNFKISCSGSSGRLYDGSSSTSVSYTPPTYGTSYRYTNVFTASNTYGDSFSATVYKDFTATAPYYTVGVCINGHWTPCVAYVYRDGWKECHPYAYRDNQWRLCDYS